MIDYNELRAKIRVMTPKTRLYALLKTELSALNRWKNLPRGNPVKAKQVSDKVKGLV